MDKEILKTLRYFAFFSYSPTFEELYRYLERACNRAQLTETLQKMAKKGHIKKMSFPPDRKISIKAKYPVFSSFLPAGTPTSSHPLFVNSFLNTSHQIGQRGERYTLGEYGSNGKDLRLRVDNSLKKLKKAGKYLRFLSYFPQIQLIGISGSVAMLSAQKKDDIDLFIITQYDRLWMGRMIALVLAQLLGVRRRRYDLYAPGKICLNLFFSGKDMRISPQKRSIYTAHEVLQMKPFIDKNHTYLRFLDANRWVFDIFPNAKSSKQEIINTKQKKDRKSVRYPLPVTRLLGDGIEYILKKLQLSIINRHRTTEIITDTQLWFFPKDFEKKLGTIHTKDEKEI